MGIKIKKIKSNKEVFDITVEDNHNFYGGGLLVSNCQEIALPTVPLKSFDDPDGVISLCTLAALNFGKVKSPNDFEKPAKLVVRFLDELLTYQNYPVPAANNSTKMYRPLGVGIVNLAYFLAKNGRKYEDSETHEMIHEYMEGFSYYLIKASVDLAKEKGSCEGIHNTKYGQGILPIDTYKKDVDELAEAIYNYDWETLREDLKTYGIRNATLAAIMPSETSSQISNSTNGIEPIRSLVTEKASKDGILRQVVPEINKLKNKYDMLWDQKSPKGYLNVCAVIQKFIDQSISTNTSYNPENYEDGEIPMSVMIGDLLHAYKYGIHNLYYFNTYDGQKDANDMNKIDENVLTESEEFPEFEDGDCDSCKL